MHCLMFKHMYDMKNTKNTQKPTSLWWDSVYIHILLGTANGLIPTVSSASWRSASKRLFSACSAETWQCWGDGLDSFNPIHWLWHRWCFRFWMAVDEKLRSFILRPHMQKYADICRRWQLQKTGMKWKPHLGSLGSTFGLPASCKTVRGRKLRLHKFTRWLGLKRNVELKNLDQCLNPSDPKSCTSALFASLSLMFWISSLQLFLYYFRSLEGFRVTV